MLKEEAGRIVAILHEKFGNDIRAQQALALAEEAGEAVGAMRRYMGMARRVGNIDEVREELADVVITAWVTAAVFDVDLESAIAAKLVKLHNRSWRDADEPTES